MATKRDFEKEQKRQTIAKRGFECPYAEIPKTGSYADQKRYLDSKPAKPKKANKENQLVSMSQASKIYDCPFCNARVVFITTHVQERHPDQFDEFRKSRIRIAPSGTRGLRSRKPNYTQIFKFDGVKKRTSRKKNKAVS